MIWFLSGNFLMTEKSEYIDNFERNGSQKTQINKFNDRWEFEMRIITTLIVKMTLKLMKKIYLQVMKLLMMTNKKFWKLLLKFTCFSTFSISIRSIFFKKSNFKYFIEFCGFFWPALVVILLFDKIERKCGKLFFFNHRDQKEKSPEDLWKFGQF